MNDEALTPYNECLNLVTHSSVDYIKTVESPRCICSQPRGSFLVKTKQKGTVLRSQPCLQFPRGAKLASTRESRARLRASLTPTSKKSLPDRQHFIRYRLRAHNSDCFLVRHHGASQALSGRRRRPGRRLVFREPKPKPAAELGTVF